MENVELSVVIPAYNAAGTIEKCLDTIINQNIKDMEIIVINDGSADGTLELLKQYKMRHSNVRVASAAQNRGVSHARNIGLRIARGRYITFVDADDYLEADMYRAMLCVMERYDADIVECSCRKVKPDGRILAETHLKRQIIEGDKCLEHYLRQKDVQNYMVNKLYKRKFFERKRFLALKFSEDYCMNVLVHGEVHRKVILPDVYYNYVIHDKSACGGRAGLDRYDGVKAGRWILDHVKTAKSKHYIATYICRFCISNAACMSGKLKSRFIQLVKKDYIYALFKIKPFYFRSLGEWRGYFGLISFLLKNFTKKRKVVS